MNKKLIIGYPLFFIPTFLVMSCSTSENSIVNNLDELNNSFKSIITKDSAAKIDDIVFNKTTKQQITKEEIISAIELDENTFLNKELLSLNKVNEYKDELSSTIINICSDEHQNETTLKHGCIFRKHFWESVWMQARSSYLVVIASSFWWAAQIVPLIIKFIETKDGSALADALSSFIFNVPSYFVTI